MSTQGCASGSRLFPIDNSAALRRSFDVIFALTALFLLSPLMLVVMMAIWIETGRPILFSQSRIGKKGRPFEMYKFRKFGTQCGVEGRPLTVGDDDRMTAVGRILLLTKLDELPQFVNVLRGDMAIVGPRPESLYFAECFETEFAEILDHKPGIFGPSQVIFRHENRLYPEGDPVEFYKRVLFPAKAKIDLDYYRRRTLWSDLGWVGRAFLRICGTNWQGLTRNSSLRGFERKLTQDRSEVRL